MENFSAIRWFKGYFAYLPSVDVVWYVFQLCEHFCLWQKENYEQTEYRLISIFCCAFVRAINYHLLIESRKLMSVLMILTILGNEILHWSILQGWLQKYLRFSLEPNFCDILTFVDLTVDFVKTKYTFYERAT